MKFAIEAVVLGMKRSKGEGDFGKYDSTKIFVEDGISSKDQDDVRGCTTVAYAIGGYDEFQKYASLTFPLRATLEMESLAGSKNQAVLRVVSFRPLAGPKAGEARKVA